jgi:DNA polymerase III epsilon subunit-like protein
MRFYTIEIRRLNSDKIVTWQTLYRKSHSFPSLPHDRFGFLYKSLITRKYSKKSQKMMNFRYDYKKIRRNMTHYILFDTETTGNQEEDRIIQVGALILYGRELEVYDELCSTPQKMSIEAMEVHHITPNMIADKPLYRETAFAKRLEELNHAGNYLIAHNISFDLGMVQKEGFSNQYQLIDTVRCAKHLYPELPYHRLQYLRYALELYREEKTEADKINITIKAHEAIGDVLILKLLLSKLRERCETAFPEAKVMEKLVELTHTPVMMKTFKFGKYKGRKVEEIAHEDAGYLRWMRKNLDLDEDLTYTLDYYLEQF